MAKKHENYLISLFNDNTLILKSSELCDKICEFDIYCTRSNARKIIETAVKKSLIQSSKPMTFGNNQYLYYSNKGSRDFLISKLEFFGTYLSRISHVISLNGQIISYSELIKISACTTKKTSTKVKSLEEIIDFLQRKDVLDMKKESYKGINFLISKKIDNESKFQIIQDYINKMNIDVLLIKPILFFLKNINLIDSREITKFRNFSSLDNLPKLNNLGWDAYGYTYTTGFYDSVGNKEPKKSTFLALDLKISRNYTLYDLQGFYNRIQIYRNSVKNKKKIRNIIPVIFAKGSNIYGENFDNLVNQLIPLYSYKFNSIPYPDKEIIIHNIESVLEFIKNSGHTISFGNMKGDLFELLMSTVISEIYNIKDVIIKKNYKLKDLQYDFVVQTKTEIIVIEVKGYKKDKKIPLGYFDKKKQKPQRESVKWFFNYTFDIFKNNYMGGPEHHNLDVRACYITTSKFDPIAIKYLENLNRGKLKPTNLNLFYDRDQLINLLGENKLYDEIKIINNYFN